MQRRREASRATEAEFGIGAAQCFVLRTLAETPGLSVNELAARTCTHQSSVSAVLGKLIERGLVTARASRDDGRRRRLRLTPKGARIAAAGPHAIQAKLIGAIDAMRPEERRRLAQGLRRLVAGLGEAERARMFLEERHRR